MLTGINIAGWMVGHVESTRTAISNAVYWASVKTLSSRVFNTTPKIIVNISSIPVLPGHTSYEDDIIVRALEESLGGRLKKVLVSKLLEESIERVSGDLGISPSKIAIFLSAPDDVSVETILSQVNSIRVRGEARVGVSQIGVSGSVSTRKGSSSKILSTLTARDIKRLVYTEFSRRISNMEGTIIIDTRPGSYESWVALTSVPSTPTILYIRYALARPKLASDAIRAGGTTLAHPSIYEYRSLVRSFLVSLVEEAGKDRDSRDFSVFTKYILTEGLSPIIENLLVSSLDTSLPTSLLLAGWLIEEAYEYTLEDLRKSYGDNRIASFTDALRLASKGEINLPKVILSNTVANNIYFALVQVRSLLSRTAIETGEKGFESYVKLLSNLSGAKARTVKNYMLVLSAISHVSLTEDKMVAVDERTIATLMGVTSSSKIRRIIEESQRIGLVFVAIVNENLVVIPARSYILSKYLQFYDDDKSEEIVRKAKSVLEPVSERDRIIAKVLFGDDKTYEGYTGYLVDKLLL